MPAAATEATGGPENCRGVEVTYLQMATTYIPYLQRTGSSL